jgi:hypothetical protein
MWFADKGGRKSPESQQRSSIPWAFQHGDQSHKLGPQEGGGKQDTSPFTDQNLSWEILIIANTKAIVRAPPSLPL